MPAIESITLTKLTSRGLAVPFAAWLAGCASWSPGLPPTRSSTPARRLGDASGCEPTFVTSAIAGHARRLRVSGFDEPSLGFREDGKERFVFFYWTPEAGRVAVEYVLAVDDEAPLEVRTYDREAGARYQLDQEAGAWLVRGEPSARFSCR